MTTEVKVGAHSSGKVKVEILDPTRDDALVSEVTLEPGETQVFYATSTAKVVVEEVAP